MRAFFGTLWDLVRLLGLILTTPAPHPDTESIGDAGVWPRNSDSGPKFLIQENGDTSFRRMVDEDRAHRKRYGRDPG